MQSTPQQDSHEETKICQAGHGARFVQIQQVTNLKVPAYCKLRRGATIVIYVLLYKEILSL